MYTNNNDSVQQKRIICRKCGKKNNISPACYAQNLYCKFCKMNGHVQKVCFKKNEANNTQAIKHVENTENVYSIDRLHFVGDHGMYPPDMIDLKINGKWVQLEFDTGSRNTVIPENIFCKISSSECLRSTNTTFKYYSQNVITPKGVATVKVA